MILKIRGKDVLAGSSVSLRGSTGQTRLARVVTIALLGLMMFAGFGVAAPERAFAGQAGTINTNGVEIFEHPTDLTVIGYVGSGDRVDIFWGPEFYMYEIRTSDGTVGWVWAEFVDTGGGGSSGGSSDSASSAPASTSANSADQAGAWSWSAWAMIDADSLNVRNDASASAGVVDSYGPGEWVEVIGNEVNGYSPVNYYGDIGWVASQYLSWDGNFNNATVSSGAATSSGGGSATSGQEHWIDVNGATGQVTLYVGDSVYATYWGSVGFDTSSDGFYSTASGTYYVYAMHDPLAYTAWAEAYITEWVGFDPSRFNGFHSYTKDGNGNILPNGGGKTGGCVALPPGESQAVYDFSFVGMRVEVHR
ncbi:MAG: SH3 domain-containing protein [Chloroflexota bacterium]|nr:SH3 domain-containing protein [Chloroflexota bacterium]